MKFLFFILLTGCSIPHKRPYTNADNINNQQLPTSALINIEDFFLHKLRQNGCTLAPKKLFSTVLHHQVALSFDDKRMLVSCDPIQEKPALITEAQEADIDVKINHCLENTCQELIGVVFDAAPVNADFSLSLPLLRASK